MTDTRAVYFIGGADTPIKIGVASNPRQRFLSIQTCSPLPLRLLAWIPGAGLAGEQETHRRFAADRAHGEWFRPSPELLAFIAEAAESNAAAERARRERLAKLAAHPIRQAPECPAKMTASQVAERLTAAGVPVSGEAVRQWARAGRIPSTRTPTGRRWFLPSVVTDVLNWHDGAEVAS